MNKYVHTPVKPEPLHIYDVMHLFIPTDGDEEDVQVFSHSQSDWEELKTQRGKLWTIPTTILDGRVRCLGGYEILDNPPKTPYDLWQWATCWGYLGEEIK